MIKEKSEEKEAGALGSEGEAEKREGKEAGRRRSTRAKETESKGKSLGQIAILCGFQSAEGRAGEKQSGEAEERAERAEAPGKRVERRKPKEAKRKYGAAA